MNKFFKENWPFLLKIIVSGALVCFIGIYSFSFYIQSTYSSSIYTHVENVTEQYPIAIVFGAGVWNGNQPSPVLYDRLVTAVDLYKAGRVRKLLLTGDNRFVDYNEPAVMEETAFKLGVPKEDLILDFAGRRTYDSCFRAAHIFGVHKAILITQNFHLPRALYLCQAFGIEAIGVTADRRVYRLSSRLAWWIREHLAQIGSWVNLTLWHPRKPLLGDKVVIE